VQDLTDLVLSLYVQALSSQSAAMRLAGFSTSDASELAASPAVQQEAIQVAFQSVQAVVKNRRQPATKGEPVRQRMSRTAALLQKAASVLASAGDSEH
jgi:uncharacterized membrane protein